MKVGLKASGHNNECYLFRYYRTVLWTVVFVSTQVVREDIMITCYVARAMSGKIKEDVVREAKADKEFLEKAGFKVLCPVFEEGVEPTKQILRSSKQAMDRYWSRDKQMIREAHVIFNMSPDQPSLGVIREYGYARYCLWKKVISVFPPDKIPAKAAICHYEDDYVTDSLLDAIGEAYRTHGTWLKRFNWRISMLNRCLVKWFWYQLNEFK